MRGSHVVVNAVWEIAALEPSQPLGVRNYRCYLLDETGRFADP
jgi:hypothetical protein